METRTIFKRTYPDLTPGLRVESLSIKWEPDEDADLSHLGKCVEEAGPTTFDRTALPHWDRHQYRYFLPANHLPHNPKNWASVDKKAKQECIKEFGSLAATDRHYAQEDWKRFEAAGTGKWCMMGCYCKVEVTYPLVGNNGSRRLEYFQRGGLWGIESDSGEEHVAEIEISQLEELRDHLKVFGIPWPAELEDMNVARTLIVPPLPKRR